MPFTYKFSSDYYSLFVYKPMTLADSTSKDITVTLFPLWYKQLTLEWSIPADWGGCTFNVYRSEIPEQDFVRLNQTSITGNFFKDTTNEDFSKFHKSYYVVEAVLPGGARVRSESITWKNRRNSWVELRAQEIQRREWLLLRKFVGVDSYIFRRKNYGQRCRECWNFELQKVVKDNCKTCMGTSFDGGYFPGIQTLLQYDVTPNKISLEYFGKFESNQLAAWTISFPEVSARDIVFRTADKSIFVINDWANTELQTEGVRHIFQLTQLAKDCPEYRLLISNSLIPLQYQT